MRVWNTEGGTPLATLRGPDGPDSDLTCVVFSPDGNRVATGSLDNAVRIWDDNKGTELLVLGNSKSPINSISFSPHGTRIVSGNISGQIRVWDSTSGAELAAFGGSRGEMLPNVLFTPDGQRIVSESLKYETRGLSHGRAPKKLRQVWDAATFRRVGIARDWYNVPTAELTSDFETYYRGQQTLIYLTGVKKPVAWFPVRLSYHTTRTFGRTWAGSVFEGAHLYILTLENPPNASAALGAEE